MNPRWSPTHCDPFVSERYVLRNWDCPSVRMYISSLLAVLKQIDYLRLQFIVASDLNILIVTERLFEITIYCGLRPQYLTSHAEVICGGRIP